MEWTEGIRAAIDYMEAHIWDSVSPEDTALAVGLPLLYLQRGFEVVTGYTMNRYLRYRRLYLAALDLAAGKGRVIDEAYRCGFETPESFTKAFTRFHGAAPTQIREDHSRIKVFLPLKITIIVQGGENVEYSVESMKEFEVIGFQREFSFDSSYGEIPKFWDEFSDRYMRPLFAGKKPETEAEKTVCQCMVGEYGVCIDDGNSPGKFRYLIAGQYHGEPVPEGMTVFRFPDMDWAKFPCRGPLPGALQAVNTEIFQEWLPGNKEYTLAMGANIEWYSPKGDTGDSDYESAIWVPVRKK